MVKKDQDVEIEIGSGNVFKDFGYPNPELAQAKADLARQIHQTIKKRKLTQAQAAKLMGIDQPKVSDVIRGRLAKYSIDRLMRFLVLLGKDVAIQIMDHRAKTTPPRVYVKQSARRRRPSI